jgi:hypothetical protein
VLPVKRWLSGDGGTVVAVCEGSKVHLSSLIPAQGYQVGPVQSGPAAMASVVFTGFGNRIVARVVCSAGVPVLAVDDGGFDH